MKIIKDIAKIDIVLLLVVGYVLKMLIFGANWPLSVAFFALCAVYGYRKYLNKLKIQDVNTQIVKKINEIQNSVDALKLEKGLKLNEKKTIRKF
jgi:hypothetical protein